MQGIAVGHFITEGKERCTIRIKFFKSDEMGFVCGISKISAPVALPEYGVGCFNAARAILQYYILPAQAVAQRQWDVLFIYRECHHFINTIFYRLFSFGCVFSFITVYCA